MDMNFLKKILEDVRVEARCNSCPLKKFRNIKNNYSPLIFEPDREVRVMVITYGPNRTEKPEVIASLANHPTYTYLSALFGGKFEPTRNATAYWTHLRKCFIDVVDKSERSKIDKQATEICSENYLIDEIKAVQPELILAVGERVVDFLSKKISKDKKDDRLNGGLRRVFMSQEKGMLNNVELEMGLSVNVAVVPHPSGRNTFFVNSSPEEKEKIARILDSIRENIMRLIP